MKQDLAQKILEKTNMGLQVFNLYMPLDFTPKKRFKNPFYQDTKASCFIYYDRKLERYYMKDHGDPTYSGDCFWLVGLVKQVDYKTNFPEILRIINHDMGLGLDMKDPALAAVPTRMPQYKQVQATSLPTKTKGRKFELKSRDMTDREFAFWKQYGITSEVLERYGVVAIASYTTTGDNGTYTIRSMPDRFAFGYTMADSVKIYRPQDKNRFLYGGNKSCNYCFGLKQLPTSGDMVIITGGEKDVMTLVSHGFNAVCFNSETADFPKRVMTLLNERFRHIIVMYDCDETGKTAMQRQSEAWESMRLITITLPLAGTKEDKDVSDFFKQGKPVSKLKALIDEAISATFEDSMLLIGACEMDFSTPPTKSQQVVTVDDVPIASCDNLTCITGGEGTGKSNFVSSLLAGSLLTEPPEQAKDFLGFDIAPNVDGKAVIHFDTEQTEQQLYKNTMMMMKRAGLSQLPDFYHSLFLTTLDREQRLQLIRDSMSLYYQKHGGVYMVVIDGVADLVHSANDEAGSIAVVEELYKLASCYHACILCVVHYVPNGIKLRGHLGSELQRKSASILSVEKDENPAYSVVKAMKLRDGNPLNVPMQQFTWDKELDMFTFAGTKSEVAAANRKKKLLEQIVESVYIIGKEGYTHKELVKRVEDEADVKERTAKSYISDLYNARIIIKQGDKYFKNNNKTNEEEQ